MVLEVLSTNSWILLTGTLPNESEVQNLPKLSRLKLRNNRITGKDPLFIPKFILDLPMWVITTQILIQDIFIKFYLLICNFAIIFFSETLPVTMADTVFQMCL